MSSTILSKTEKFVQEYFESKHDSRYEFHDIDHTTSVVAAIKQLCNIANLKDHEKLDLTIAAWFHDLGYTSNPQDHEFESAKMAADFLEGNSMPAGNIEKIKNLILATNINWSGQDYHSLLLKDADLSHLASDNFFDINNKLRRENKHRNGSEISDADWLKSNISFLEAHNYKSKEGKILFEEKKLQILNKLKLMAKSNQETELLFDDKTLTQFETTMKNHIELSAIADNKANIMLTVNVIISTVGLPLMFNILKSHAHFLVPIIILSSTCLISIIYATLCTRPIKMSGYTNLSDVPDKKSNLFFFGNFYNMTFSDFEEGLLHTISDKSLFENAITRNLYDLGKSLGKKYIQLRYSYNFFMFGIILTIISFIGILLFA